MFITILGGLYASILGATILVKEESDKTIEFLYSKPVSRNQIVTSKIVCGVINILIMTIVVTLFNLCGLAFSGDLDVEMFLHLSITPILLYYLLFFISLLISTFLTKSKKSMSIGIGIVFASYFLQVIGNMSSNVKIIKNLSVFEFVSSREIILNGHIKIGYLIAGVIIITACIVATYVKYNKKELV